MFFYFLGFNQNVITGDASIKKTMLILAKDILNTIMFL